MSEWISIHEQDPPENEMVLCFNPKKDYDEIGGLGLEAGPPPGMSIDYGWRRNVTHWMPLSPLPGDY